MPVYSSSEQFANRITHAIGAILSIVGLIFLIIKSLEVGVLSHTLSGLLFGFSLILLYASSTLYHTVPKKNALEFFRKLDHASIFI